MRSFSPSAGVVTVDAALVEAVLAGALPFEVLDDVVDVVAGEPDDDGAPTLATPPEEGAEPMVMAAAVVRGEP